MSTKRSEIIKKSARIFGAFISGSILALCILPTNSFANESSSSSSAPSKVSESKKDDAKVSEKNLDENQARGAKEDQTVKAENYKKAWDDAMVAAPAFGE